MILYQFKVKLYDEREYILYEKKEGSHTYICLKPIHALHDMAHFIKSVIITNGKRKTRYYLIYKELEHGWTDQEKIAFDEAKAYLEELSKS